jgi:hypothetical protein
MEISRPFCSDLFSAFRLFISISILSVSRARSRATHSCFNVWISSLSFCSKLSTSLCIAPAIVFNAKLSLRARTLSSVRSSDNAALKRYAAYTLAKNTCLCSHSPYPPFLAYSVLLDASAVLSAP